MLYISKEQSKSDHIKHPLGWFIGSKILTLLPKMANKSVGHEFFKIYYTELS